MLGMQARWRRCGLTLSMSWLALLAAQPVHAQSVTLDRYRGSETVDDGFALSRPDDQGHLRLGAILQLDYANDPLVLELDAGDAGSESARVVSDQLGAQLTLSLGIAERLVVFAGVRADLVLKGEQFEDPATGNDLDWASGPGLGDTRLGARVRLLGERDDVFALAVQASAILPTAQAADGDQRLLGENSLALIPKVLAELRLAGIRVTANLGALVREDVVMAGTEIGDELLYGLGVTVPIVPKRLELLGELSGGTGFSDFGDRETSPLELIAGGKLWFGRSCALGLGGGPGLQRGVGAPHMRVIASFGCASVEPQPPPADADGDGLIDERDRCPSQPEDRDGWQDEDGCPDPDNDADGVLDAADRCPSQAEDRDQFEDDDGCPDPDNDGDGLLDAADRCPDQAEDRDQFEDDDGCPDPDNDGDGVLDVEDQCPTAPGRAHKQGCPEAVRVESGSLALLKRIEFATNSERILPSGEGILDEVRATLLANPQIKRVRVQGHTDDRGNDAHNMQLSKRRAASVVQWLREHGVPADRVEGAGCGETRPIADNKTPQGQQDNRRVEFLIIEPAAAAAAGCELN
jgi:outer membrane protein OmpA-like peptidoglycan-associated protein